MTKQKKLRHLEYYDLQDTFDKLYADSKNNKIFTKLMQDSGLLRPLSFYQYSTPRQSAAVTESRRRFYRCALQGRSKQ